SSDLTCIRFILSTAWIRRRRRYHRCTYFSESTTIKGAKTVKKLNWVILGTGTIANSFAKAFEAEKATLYGAASRNKEKAQGFCEQYAIPNYYGSYEEALNDANVDVVYIAVPHNHHYELIKAALHAEIGRAHV